MSLVNVSFKITNNLCSKPLSKCCCRGSCCILLKSAISHLLCEVVQSSDLDLWRDLIWEFTCLCKFRKTTDQSITTHCEMTYALTAVPVLNYSKIFSLCVFFFGFFRCFFKVGILFISLFIFFMLFFLCCVQYLEKLPLAVLQWVLFLFERKWSQRVDQHLALKILACCM